MKTGGRLVKHVRYYWLLLAEGHLTRTLFGAILRRLVACLCPQGEPTLSLQAGRAAQPPGTGGCLRNSPAAAVIPVLAFSGSLWKGERVLLGPGLEETGVESSNTRCPGAQ